MDYDDNRKFLKELFDKYAKILRQEFHGIQSFHNAHEELASIAEIFWGMGLYLATTGESRVATLHHYTDNTEQRVIVYTFNLKLYTTQKIPFREALFETSVETKVFGPCTIPIQDNTAPISPENEEWFRRMIDSALPHTPNTDTPS